MLIYFILIYLFLYLSIYFCWFIDAYGWLMSRNIFFFFFFFFFEEICLYLVILSVYWLGFLYSFFFLYCLFIYYSSILCFLCMIPSLQKGHLFYSVRESPPNKHKFFYRFITIAGENIQQIDYVSGFDCNGKFDVFIELVEFSIKIAIISIVASFSIIYSISLLISASLFCIFSSLLFCSLIVLLHVLLECR